MAAVRIPIIKEFPKDGRYWRVDWLGALEPNPQITTEPYIQVIISPFQIDPLSLHTEDELASIEVTDANQQKVIRIGSGQLPFIEIGSIWRNGVHQGIYAGVTEELKNLQITDQTVRIVSAVHKEHGLCIIPYRHYRISRAGASTLLVAVEHNGDPYGILIPAIELIRFYYALSTNLAYALFSGVFQHNLDWIINTGRTKYQAEDNRVVLGLRQQFTDEEGWVIARILYTKNAAQACKKIYDDVIKNAANKQYINLTSGFPFIGETSLTARVKRIEFDETEGRRLVLSLTRCTAPMPYSELTIIRDNDANKADPATDIPDDKKKAYKRSTHNTSANEHLELQSQKDTNASLSSAVLSVASNRFSALENRKPDKPTKEQCAYQSGGLSRKDFAVDALGTGMGGHGETEQRVQKVSIVPERNRVKAATQSFELFIAAVNHLNQQEGISAHIRQTHPELNYLPLTKPSGKWQWSYIDSSRKTRRHVMIADIKTSGNFFTLIEFSLRDNEKCTVALISSKEKYLQDQQIKELLRKCALHKGVWSNVQPDERYVNISSLKHTWSDTLSFSESIKKRAIAAT